MAEVVLRHEWEARGKDSLIVSSMGIHGLDNQEASQYAQEVCGENGIDLTEHRSRRLIIPELEEADIILSMEKIQRDFIQLFFPKFSDKNFLLGAWPDKETKKSEIRDPVGGSLKVYRQVYDIIYKHIDRIIPAIEEMYFY
jgi:protein-tyrosine phosphatase